MKILITGASGFMGSALVRFLKARKHELTCLSSKNCNLLQADSLEAFSDEKYDFIFHLAAWTQAGEFCLHHAGEQWLINQLINTHVLAWWQEQQPQAKLIIMGTSCAYEPGANLIEDNYMKGEPIDSLYTYAMTKRMLLQGTRALAQQFGLRWLCAVPSTLYGPNYHTDGRQMHFIFDLIRKILRGRDFGESVVLWGDGRQMRELVLVDDFVAILWHLAISCENEIFNIGSGKEYSIRYYAHQLCKIIGYPEDAIIYDTTKYTGAASKCLNIEKATAVLHDAYRLTSLEDGLRRTVDWFERNSCTLHKTNM